VILVSSDPFKGGELSLPEKNSPRVDKHTSLFSGRVSDEDKSLIRLKPRVNVIKLVSFIADDEVK